MEKLIKKKEEFLKVAREANPDEDRELMGSNRRRMNHLVRSLEYLAKLLNVETTAQEKRELTTEWCEELQRVEESDTLTMMEKLQQSLECLEMILLGGYCKI